MDGCSSRDEGLEEFVRRQPVRTLKVTGGEVLRRKETMSTTSLGQSLEPPEYEHHPNCYAEDSSKENVWYRCFTYRWQTYNCSAFRFGPQRNLCPDCGLMARRIEDCTCDYLIQ